LKINDDDDDYYYYYVMTSYSQNQLYVTTIPHRGTLPEHLHKNHDVTIMTSWGHVTSSGAWSIDNPWALSYYAHWNNYLFIIIFV